MYTRAFYWNTVSRMWAEFPLINIGVFRQRNVCVALVKRPQPKTWFWRLLAKLRELA